MRKKTKPALLLSWIVLVIPFTFLGYGSDGDAWRIARAAESIWKTGEYTASRSTGFPLFELLETAPVHLGNWYMSNLLPFFAGIFLLLALFRLSGNGHFRYPLLVPVSIAFLPVVVKNASSTMDYIPGLALLIWAYVMMVEKRYIVCAIFVGIACGFRPTNGLFIIPCVLYHVVETKEIRSGILMLTVAGLTGLIAFSPALFKYGLKADYALMAFDLKTKLFISGYNFLQLFGIVQWIVILAIFLFFLLRSRVKMKTHCAASFLAFHFANIILWILLFTQLPDEPEYLLPMVPSAIFMLDRLANRKTFAFVTGVLLLFHLVRLEAIGGESGSRTVELSIKPGYTIADVEDRIFKLSVREILKDFSINRPTILMYGEAWIPTSSPDWIFDFNYRLHRQRNGNFFVADVILDEDRLRELKTNGFRLLIWRNDKWEYIRSGKNEWRNYVEIVDDLEVFLRKPVRGKPLTIK